jgi:hypothetical protein
MNNSQNNSAVALTISSFLTTMVGFVILGLVTIGIAILQGFVVSQLWQWYVVPMMNVPPMNILGAWGVCLMATCIFNPALPEKGNLLVVCLLTLFFGWLGTWYM